MNSTCIKLLSYNIWFSDYAMKRRMRAIGDLIGQHVPHVVALQEVTEEHWSALSAHAVVSAYDWSAPPEQASYYTMIGSLKSWSKINDEHRREFETTLMDRDLLSVVLRPKGCPPIVIGTAHLESLDMVRARSEQIAQATGWLASTATASAASGLGADVVLCGDTNLQTGRLKGNFVEEQVRLPPQWQDAWEICGSGAGYTFDAFENRMVGRLDRWARAQQAQLRYDRFWTRLSSYTCISVDIIGTSPLPLESAEDGSSEELWPSDHFGVLLTLGPAATTSESVGPSASARAIKRCAIS